MKGMEGGEPMKLGQYIKELRRQRHLTQRQLAEKISVDFSYLSKIENDRLEHTPSLKTLQDLAKALEVDELELMELAGKVPTILQAIARNKDAMRFFRRATETIKTLKGGVISWRISNARRRSSSFWQDAKRTGLGQRSTGTSERRWSRHPAMKWSYSAHTAM